MSIWEVIKGKAKRKYLNATDIQVLDVANRFKHKNLERVLNEIGTGSAQSVANLEHRVNNLSSPNLIMNSNFTNPINKRAKTEYKISNGDVYTIDRWKMFRQTGTNDFSVNLSNDGIVIKNQEGTECGILQYLELNIPDGIILTISACIDNRVRSLTGELSSVAVKEIKDGFKIGFVRNSSGYVTPVLYSNDNKEHIIKWVKLEIGEKPTPFAYDSTALDRTNCSRYYDVELMSGIAVSSTLLHLGTSYRNPKRTTPSVQIYNVANSVPNKLSIASSEIEIDPSKVTLGFYTENASFIKCTEPIFLEGKTYFFVARMDSEIY